jgi:hypothetical protein
MRRSVIVPRLCTVLAVIAASASAQVAEPHRQAGWWEMAAHLPNGTTMTRYLCLDAAFDSRHSVLAKQEGCTPTVEAVTGGYSFKKTCGGETTTGTAIGDFNSAYKITEQRGSASIQTDARLAGACPAGRKPGDMQLPNGSVVHLD